MISPLASRGNVWRVVWQHGLDQKGHLLLTSWANTKSEEANFRNRKVAAAARKGESEDDDEEDEEEEDQWQGADKDTASVSFAIGKGFVEFFGDGLWQPRLLVFRLMILATSDPESGALCFQAACIREILGESTAVK